MTTKTTDITELDLDWLRTQSPDSPILSAYESGVARALQGRPLPAGASTQLAKGYYAAQEAIDSGEEL